LHRNIGSLVTGRRLSLLRALIFGGGPRTIALSTLVSPNQRKEHRHAGYQPQPKHAATVDRQRHHQRRHPHPLQGLGQRRPGRVQPFYGYNRLGAKESQGVRDTFWAQGMQCGIRNAYDCIKQFSETDFTEDLKKIDVPTLIVHGDDDQIVPIDASARASAKLVKNATLLVYEGAPHGLPTTHKDKLNADLLAFLKA
jgi:pimeloyl-ACP methyl ester carboxylesterase